MQRKLIEMFKLERTLMLIILYIQRIKSWDCEPGEMWFENCAICECFENSRVFCIPKFCTVEIAHCQSPRMSWYEGNYRCHCLYNYERPIVICIKLEFPKKMNNQTCSLAYPVVFGECVYCKCNNNNRTICVPKANCGKDIDICVPNEHKIFGCLNCTCTHTMLRKCYFIEDCYLNKPGRCPKQFTVFDIRCTLSFKQACYYDGQCNGPKKCCFTDCRFECLNPIK